MQAIRAENIHKNYKDTLAVSGINFSVEKAELFGLIGPDGAGKTTLFKILTSLLIPSKGDAWVEGFHTVKEYREIRKIIGYMPGKFSLYEDLTVEENLNFFATIFGTSVSENYDLIKEIYVQLEPFKKRRAGKLSGGMKQKLALCCALVHEPKVLFLDEPTTGVDAVSRTEFWEMLSRLKSKGISILVSTPYMDEAILCERIALIQHSKIHQIDTPQNIIDGYGKPLYKISSDRYYQLLQDLRSFEITERAEAFGEYLHLTTKGRINLAQLRTKLTALGHQNLELEPTKASIEDVFLDLE
jgi:ABC-type multidrug transport system ATPase subunit